MADDQELVHQAQQGQRAAVAALYGRYHAQVYRYIAYRVGDRFLADDLTAEVFVTMVRHLDRYEERGRPFLAWLYAIAANIVKMHYRSRQKVAFEPLPEELVDPEANPAEIAQSRLTQSRLLAALPALTDDQREVILLKFIEGFSNTEIAAMLERSEGAVRILQHRALNALRRVLAEEVHHGAA